MIIHYYDNVLLLMYTVCRIIIHVQAPRLRLAKWFCDLIGSTVLHFNTLFLAGINVCPYWNFINQKSEINELSLYGGKPLN